MKTKEEGKTNRGKASESSKGGRVDNQGRQSLKATRFKTERERSSISARIEGGISSKERMGEANSESRSGLNEKKEKEVAHQTVPVH